MQLQHTAHDNSAWPPDSLEPVGLSETVTSGAGVDTIMEHLVRALLPDRQASEVLRGFYTGALHATLLECLADLRANNPTDGSGRRLGGLQAWRLKRVHDYVDANLEERITLASLAEAAGLSRMYFAAQFRMATGVRPHDYVISRRIERAKTMLLQTDTPIVGIALSVGFQSQAHFAAVFKRTVGFTPLRWRALHAEQERACIETTRPYSNRPTRVSTHANYGRSLGVPDAGSCVGGQYDAFRQQDDIRANRAPQAST